MLMTSNDFPLLDRIQSPADLRSFEEDQLVPLADELRAFLIQSLSKTGGHLASGLGSVEITIVLHYLFDKATAILAGDALQALAFYILSHDPEMTDNHKARLQMIEKLSLFSGSRGMAGGQAIDLISIGKRLNIAELETMHIHKTGAMTE